MKYLIILMASFFSSIFGTKGQLKKPVYPPEKFFVVEAKLSNGKPVVGSFNMGYKKYDMKKEYPWCLTINIGLDLKQVTKDGLPLKTESDIANKFEDQLLKDISKFSVIHYIGHLYKDSFLDIYIYLDNPEQANQYLQMEVNKKGIIRGFAYDIKQDPNWDTVKPFLK